MNSDNTPPPLPQPTSYTCPHCGFGYNQLSDFCPRCGAAQTPVARQKASTGTLVAYGCGFVVLGAIGACFSLAGVSSAPYGGIKDALNPFTFIGVAAIAGALFLLFKLLRGGR